MRTNDCLEGEAADVAHGGGLAVRARLDEAGSAAKAGFAGTDAVDTSLEVRAALFADGRHAGWGHTPMVADSVTTRYKVWVSY